MWKNGILINTQNANPKSAILALYSSKNSKIFASGAIDGKANIWHLDSSLIIQKYFSFLCTLVNKTLYLLSFIFKVFV